MTKSGPPPEGYDVQESPPAAAGEEPSASAQPLSGERRSGSREAFTSLLDLGMGAESAGDESAAPSEELEEISAGAPIEEAISEKTEEVSLSPVQPPPQAPASVDLGETPMEDERPPKRGGEPVPQGKGSGKRVAVIAVVAAAAAFAAVYLAKTQPWKQEVEQVSPPLVVAKPALPPPPAAAPAPPAPAAKPAAKIASHASKPAAAEVAAKKHAVEEARPAVAEKAEPEKAAKEKPEGEKPAPETAKVAKSESEAATAKSTGKSGGKTAAKAGEEKARADQEEIYRLVFRSSPIGAEVLIDGEYFGRTPCERRILDPKKSYAITLRRAGYEPHERLLGPSDRWVKKGNERVLKVSVTLRRAKVSANATASSKEPATPETKPAAPTPEPAMPAAANPVAKVEPEKTAAAKPEPEKPAAAKPELAKPATAKPEPAKPAAATPAPAKPAAATPELVKPAAVKPAPAKPAPGAKPTVSKPAPSFQEPAKKAAE